MTTFPLKIVTSDGLQFDGQAQELVVRTTSGDTGILAGHADYVAPLGMGQAMAVIDGVKKYAAFIGGMLAVIDGKVTLVPTTFEWADQIDKARSLKSETNARAVLSDKASSQTDLKLAEAKLKRALIRQSVADKK